MKLAGTLLLFLFLGCSSSDPTPVAAGGDPPAVGRSFQTVAANRALDVAADGTLAAGLVLDNGAGICLEIEPGTRLRRTTGAWLRGAFEIGFDDGAPDVAWLQDQVGTTLGGSVRVWVRAAGTTEMLDVAFEPPAVVVLKSLPEIAGEWRFQQYDIALDDSALAGTGPGEPPSGTRWEFHDFGAVQESDVDFGSPRFLVKVSTLTGAWLNDPTLPPAGFECTDPVVFTQVLGPVGSEFPRLCCLRLTGPLTAQRVAAACWFPAGLWLPGQSRVIGPDRDILVRIVERDGNRVVEVCSPYGNVFDVDLRCCTGPEIEDRVAKQGVTIGSKDESDEVLYLGSIDVKVLHWGGIGEFFRVRDTIFAAHGLTTFDNLTPVSGGRYLACFTARAFDFSVREYAALLPPSWVFRYENRRLLVTVPCPPPTVVTRAPGANTIQVIDATTLQTVRTSDPLPGAADAVVVLPEDQAIVVTAESGEVVAVPGALHRVDLLTGAVLGSMSFPGLHTGVAVHPFGDRLFVATADGILRTLDASDLSELSRIEGLPTGRYEHIAPSLDGGAVYLAAPLPGGQSFLQGDPPPAGLLRADLLHKTVEVVNGTITITISGVSAAPDGRVAIRDTTIGGQECIRVIGNDVSDPITPGDPTDVVFRWTPENELVVGSDQEVRVYQPDLLGSVSITGTAGASSIVAYVNANGELVFIGARPAAGELFRTTRTAPDTYSNPLGVPAPAIIDTQAFASSP